MEQNCLNKEGKTLMYIKKNKKKILATGEGFIYFYHRPRFQPWDTDWDDDCAPMVKTIGNVIACNLILLVLRLYKQ
jgi:hypothetical protein